MHVFFRNGQQTHCDAAADDLHRPRIRAGVALHDFKRIVDVVRLGGLDERLGEAAVQVRAHANCHAAAEVEHTVRRAVRRSAVGHIHRDGVLRLNRKRAGLRTQFSNFLLHADEHRNIAFQLVLRRVQLLHRQQDGGNARSVVKALAGKLIAR